MEGGAGAVAGWSGGGVGRLGVDSRCPSGLVGCLWFLGGGGSCGAVCVRRFAPEISTSPGSCHAGIRWVGSSQDCAHDCTAGCCAPGGARSELARSGGGVGDHNENVLGC